MDKHFDYYIRVAGLTFHVYGLYDRITERFPSFGCAPTKYATEITVSREEIELFRQSENLGQNYPSLWIETSLVQKKICEYALAYNRMLIHGACVTYKEKAYLFTAPSGTGKTTHAMLWKKYLGHEVKILNGDKPILSFGQEIIVHGTPWMGKEHYGNNTSAPLSGIVFLKRDTACSIKRLSSRQSFPLLYNQIFFTDKQENIQYVLDGINRIISEIPIYELCCDISEQAVQCCFETLTGIKYNRLGSLKHADNT